MIKREEIKMEKSLKVTQTEVFGAYNITGFYVAGFKGGRTVYIKQYDENAYNEAHEQFKEEILDSLMMEENQYDYLAFGFNYCDGMGGAIDMKAIKFQ